MKFAKILFWVAGIWSVLMFAPLYFIFNLIGRQEPPPITHPGFYCGFAAMALAWQFAFFLIAIDPSRFRAIMIPGALGKFGWGIAVVILFAQHRISRGDMALGIVDLVFGALFVVAFVKTQSRLAT
ncbi:MAG TPA: hypothetical protein VEJ38_17710 [Candidatus Acidoferrales bacterium]|nr:hypothetical protein [Candidatus Acidoferrales bacterium]